MLYILSLSPLTIIISTAIIFVLTASQEMNPEDADEDLEAELMALLKPEQGT